MRGSYNGAMKSIVILISGRGSNMQAIIEANLPVRWFVEDRLVVRDGVVRVKGGDTGSADNAQCLMVNQ